MGRAVGSRRIDHWSCVPFLRPCPAGRLGEACREALGRIDRGRACEGGAGNAGRFAPRRKAAARPSGGRACISGGASASLGSAGATARGAPSLLLESLRVRPAFASNEASDGRIRLRLKRQAPPTDADLAIACAIRKPGGAYLVGVPRLVGPTGPPMILGGWPRGGQWLHYEAIFPDLFAGADDDLPPGTYAVAWGTLARPGGRAHVLATDSFEWPLPADQ
jgi:hypothetical protein